MGVLKVRIGDGWVEIPTIGAQGPAGPQGNPGGPGPAGADGADGADFPDAPVDGEVYGRKDGAWAEIGDSTALSTNLIVNGAMQVSQESGNASSTVFAVYPADQWKQGGLHLTGISSAQRVQVVTPKGSANRLRVVVTTAQANLSLAAEYASLEQFLAHDDLSVLRNGAVPMVLRFGFKAPAGTYALCLRDGMEHRSFVWPFTVAAGQANTDVEYEVAIPADAPGNWEPYQGIGLRVLLVIATSAAFKTATPNQWLDGDWLHPVGGTNGFATVGNTFELFDVGLHADPAATGIAPPWQPRKFSAELLECQRYWQAFAFQMALQAGAAGQQLQMTKPYLTPMRTTPAFTLSAAGTTSNASAINIAARTDNAIMLMTGTASGNTAVYNREYTLNARL